MFRFQRTFRLLPLLVGLSLLFTFGGTAFAASVTSSHQSTVKTSFIQSRVDIPHQVQRPMSLTYNCDTNSVSYGSHDGIRCAVASYATPCLNIHDINNGKPFACVAPGTVLEIMCQVYSTKVVDNNWWDAGYLPDGRYGEFSDYYMDTTWTNNNGSPNLGICATG